jgi:hypothetical protein
MAARTAWVLNLDADIELASGANYAPTRTVIDAMRPHVERLARALLGPDDVLVGEDTDAHGLSGRAFCPTPRAIALLRRAGAEPEPHPSIEVLRLVNSRAFCSARGPTLPDGSFVPMLDEALTRLQTPPTIGGRWRVKRNHGMAGRGQRVMPPLDLSFLRGSFPAGVQIEPNVTIETEYALHGMLSADGACALGALVRQACDAHGQWLATERVDAPAIAARLNDEARTVARALHEAGYFGPFGLDAFTYNGGVLQPRSEINARYSMGFPVGFTSVVAPGARAAREPPAPAS